MSKIENVPWRERPYLQMQAAAEIAAISTASIYRAAEQGQLTLKRLAGRTLVDTKTLIAFIDTAEPWTPSDRGKEARQKRVENAAENWRR